MVKEKTPPETAAWKELRLMCMTEKEYQYGDLAVKIHEGEPVRIIPEKTVSEIRFGRFKKKSKSQ